MYLERAVPGVIFCGYLFLLVQRALLYRTPPQHPVCYLLLRAWCGLAVAAASRRWSWAIRLALRVAWFGHYAVANYRVWYGFLTCSGVAGRSALSSASRHREIATFGVVSARLLRASVGSTEASGK